MADLVPSIEQCRREYGEAHDAHMEANNECPWCGHYEDEDDDALTASMARHPSSRAKS